jgi:hypothetical protein
MDETQFKIAMEDMENLTEARILFFLGQMRRTDNEWILEEMFEFGDEVQATYQAMFEAEIIEKHEYQQIVAIARMGWSQLKVLVDKVEAVCQRSPKVS